MIETKKGPFTLDAKFTLEEGSILLSGVQALARLPLDQHRADKKKGLNTATFISGYRGSPLGGLDLLLGQNKALMKENQVVFMPGVNEDLGATAVMGSQFANLFPEAKYDGVLGIWYGKAPGVDRSGDIFKHANFAGVGRQGGVLALVGDDPVAKSSTLPSHSEAALFDALMPILYPGNIQEILDLGRYGFELSRYSGLWVGLKIITNVADGFGTAEVSPDRIKIIRPDFLYKGKPWQHTQNHNLISPLTLGMEQEIHEGRLEAAKAFARVNKLNIITVPTAKAWLGIAAAGKTYYDLRQALSEMGLGKAELERHGIRLLQIKMLFPMEPEIIQEFARGLQEILVVEEKRAFIELFIREILYNLPEHPRVTGKKDLEGNSLIPAFGELDADKLVPVLVKRLSQRLELENFKAREATPSEGSPRVGTPLLMARQAYFCSGCPHNTSTVVPEGSLASAGIGCHGMALSMDRQTSGITHMGGEGAQWVGMSSFTNIPHMFQNLGDGTLFHSGYLAIRQAVASGTNITYKILYNTAVAMTGGQHPDGAMAVPELTQALKAEGVSRIIVTTEDPGKYGIEAVFGKGVEVWQRDRLDEAQRLLREQKGVTVLIHDQMCAAELRRLRKRDKAPEPPQRIFINEAVCEGCGDCGVKSNCLSVQPVETEFGRKTQIHQSSCNKDYSCQKGDCPSFLTVTPASGNSKKGKTKKIKPVGGEPLVEPELKVGPSGNIFMVGIGGTGVVTINQVLGTAAMLDGKTTRALDQTGLSQKGGPVSSHLKILKEAGEVSNKIGAGETDCFLGFDILTAASPLSLDRTNPDRTFAVISTTRVPTGAMVKSTKALFPQEEGLVEKINSSTRGKDNIYLDALRLSESYFGDHLPSNFIVVGAAFQAGFIPLTSASIEKAINLNGVAVEVNLAAFRLGRRIVADPTWAKSLNLAGTGDKDKENKPILSRTAQSLVNQVKASGELLRLLELRVPDLIAYQNKGYAQKYVDFVRQVKEVEETRTPGETHLSEAVARYLYKLMAYKDEYEVARLHLRPEAKIALEEAFGKGAKIEYQLHPPFLRAMGLKKKIKLGSWFNPIFKTLAISKGLRGTPFDPFGYAGVRKTERTLIAEYRELVKSQLPLLSFENYDRAVSLANLPDLIRGYEAIKMKNVQLFREEADNLIKDPENAREPIAF